MNSHRAETVGPQASRAEIRDFLVAHPDFEPIYRQNRRKALVLARAAYVEMTTRCNLRCEGCYYFDGGYDKTPDVRSPAEWDAFFADLAARGTRFLYLVGAEPSMVPERLEIAARHVRRGLIGTNGIRKIDRAIPFKLHISVWGAPELDTAYRGADAFSKALANYAGEADRVLFVYTLSPRNIDDAERALERVRDAGLKMTFNMYSPTNTYRNRLAGLDTSTSEFFRRSSQSDNLNWDAASLGRARRRAAELIDAFPDTLVYSRAYNDWITDPAPRYELDENGDAPHCLSRIGGSLSLTGPDLNPLENAKCCTSDVDCSTCRLYSGGLASRLSLRTPDLASRDAFANWLDICQQLFGIYIYTPDWCAELVDA
ncbi:radical SAM protein [Tropicimonas sediminicola]|uniref:Radical SAM superfamily enzyme, MoaA/NifB/PqqE/SkfB family n=1 Tax=Tropicimonas sediminicola TaxID=1031541 RepID=A0A239J5W0_9RHOB|nr:radical SAM protein [Tropicimonas sediminicola]SNT01205.1 Radical SAM superfamily enzyme, MoaA/NifB/PqqE/SkfB family [Tropicimonas sediminicola]